MDSDSVVVTVQTGAITAVTATVDLVLFVSTPVSTSPLFPNSLLNSWCRKLPCEQSIYRHQNFILALTTNYRNFFFDFSLSKLYTNSLLSTFNARAGWNNLAGNPQNRDNVLFGEPTSDPTTKRVRAFQFLPMPSHKRLVQNAAGGSTENVSVSARQSYEYWPNPMIMIVSIQYPRLNSVFGATLQPPLTCHPTI